MVNIPAKPVLEPNTPEWFKRYSLRADAYFWPVTPQRPQALFHLPTADLPPAEDYPYCIMYDETLSAVIVSDGTSWSAV
jgi:hypothetical protein